MAAARAALDGGGPDGVATGVTGTGRYQWVTFAAPAGRTVLLSSWADGERRDEATDLLEDAAHSLRMALERERALVAHQEAMALRHSRELQQTFLRRLSHELRTPLTAITGYATSLLQQDVTWDAASEQRFLSRIAAESARLGRLVNDLLDFSAIESGVFRLQGDWCDIPLVLDAAIAVLPPEAASLVEVKAAPGLPAIWADHDRLEQVFVNLLGNALTHNPPQTRVVVTAQAAGHDNVTVRVADDGEGLPPELARAVTEAARGRDPRWHEVLAAGVARPARRPGGGRARAVHRRRDRGRPPRQNRAAAGRLRYVLPDHPARGEAPVIQVPEFTVPTRVLIVEDDPNIVDLIRSNLAVRGFDTLVSIDGSKALSMLETEQPDMVLLDLMLPEVDGFELCRQIRERSPVAIIVVSARGGERDKVTALNMGADDYMTKPFGIEELLARILATLRRTRPAEGTVEATPSVIVIGEIEIDLAGQVVRLAGEQVHLTPTEFALLRELALNRGKLLSRAHLLRRVWGRGYETETEYVRVYIRRLRAKLERPGGPPLILTQPRAGYRIAVD